MLRFSILFLVIKNSIVLKLYALFSGEITFFTLLSVYIQRIYNENLLNCLNKN